MPSEEQPLGFRQFLRILWVRRWTLVLVTAVVLGTALTYSFLQTPTYTSSAEVLVRPVNFDPTRPPSSQEFVNMETEQRVATSTAVAQLAAERVAESGSPMAGIGVETSQADTLIFNSSSPDPVSATVTAQAFAEGYLEFRQQEVLEDLQIARGPLETEIEGLNRRINNVQRSLLNTPNNDANEAERQALQLEFTNLLTQRAALQARINDLIAPEDIRVGEIIQPAVRPTEPSSPDHVRTGSFALFVGLSLGIGLAFIRERMDQRVRDRTELESVTGLPVLAVVPRARRRGEAAPPIRFEQGSPVSEAYRALAASLTVSASHGKWKTVMVTSAGEGEGKTSVVANLGLALAKSGHPVILISADLRRPRLHEFLSVPNATGLSDLVFREEGSVYEAASSVEGMPNLWVLSSGTARGTPLLGSGGSFSIGPAMGSGHTPDKPLGSDAMEKLLRDLREDYDFVIIDTPPVLGIADTLSLAPMMEATIFVADAKSATRDAISEALHRLDRVEARVVGTVLTKFDPAKAGAYTASYYGSYAPPPTVHPTNGPPHSPQRDQPREGRVAGPGRQDQVDSSWEPEAWSHSGDEA